MPSANLLADLTFASHCTLGPGVTPIDNGDGTYSLHFAADCNPMCTFDLIPGCDPSHRYQSDFHIDGWASVPRAIVDFSNGVMLGRSFAHSGDFSFTAKASIAAGSAQLVFTAAPLPGQESILSSLGVFDLDT